MNFALRAAGVSLSLIGLLVAAPAFSEKEAAPSTSKKRVAVFNFEDKTDHGWYWWHGMPAGEGMADMLATSLVQSGKYRVMERDKIAGLLAEQDLGTQGIVTPQSAAKAGRMLGVQHAFIGAITEFGYKENAVMGGLRNLGVGGGIQRYTCQLAIDVRVVDTSTGEILQAQAVRKQKTGNSIAFVSDDFAFNDSKHFDDSLVGKVTREAIDEMVKALGAGGGAGGTEQWQAIVVKVEANALIINAGAEKGVKVGERLSIVRAGEELKDPETGESLGAEETKVGAIEVVDNDFGGKGKASRCKIVSGSGFAPGDVVRRK